MGAICGKLNTWYDVNDRLGLAPAGWHVPTDAEWTTLTTFLRGTEVAGGKMKAVSAFWISPNTGATNRSGFGGLPGGYNRSIGSFSFIGENGFWWSSSESRGGGWNVNLNSYDGFLDKLTNNNQNGISVRCIRD